MRVNKGEHRCAAHARAHRYDNHMKKKITAVLIIAAMIASLLSACGGNGGNGGGSADGDRAVILRLPSAITTLDWAGSNNTHDQKVYEQVYEGLYGMDEANGGYYSELAKDIALNEDETVYTITLQEGVTFQNGDSLKASDVVFSYEWAMQSAGMNYLTNMIESVEAIDDQTVQLTLKTPYSPIAHTLFRIKIMSEREITEQGETFGTVPNKAGTGPYYFDTYDVASGATLKAYEDYWKGSPAIKAIDYRVLADNAAAVISFENGELDYYEDAALSDWDSLQAAAGENSAMIKGNNIIWLGINYAANDVLGNEKVRQAIFYAVNKEDINLAVCDGMGVEATQYMPSEYVPTSPEDGFETYDYSLEKARQLLAEAGYPDGVDAGTILTTTADHSAKTAQVIQANLAEAGIHVEVSAVDVSLAVEKWNAQEFDICVYGDSGNYDFNNIRQQIHSESVGMYVIKYEGGPFEWQAWEDLLAQGVAVADVDARKEIYRKLWAMVADSATILPCLHRPVAIVWSDDLDIGEPVPTYYKVYNFKWKDAQ